MQIASSSHRAPLKRRKSSRFINTRKIKHTPGFDLASTSTSEYLYSSLHKTSFNGYHRSLNPQAERILDAPEILDDYYLNLLDWGDSGTLAVALKNKLYLWNSGSSSQMLEYNTSLITSVSWMKGSQFLAVGDSSGTLKLFDIERGQEVRSIKCHTDRISSLSWNNCVLSSGSRDASILQHDMRSSEYFVRFTGHEQEVCGLRWSPDGRHLGSGGNDNKLCIWELRSDSPVAQVNAHTAAVKALAWCPFKAHCLATGGGTADKRIKIWDTFTLECVKDVDTGSQVCALEWNPHEPELISAHGYSQNQLSLWRMPRLEKMNDFFGHTARVLCMARDPKGGSVVTASADETLRFWNAFESSKKESPQSFCYR